MNRCFGTMIHNIKSINNFFLSYLNNYIVGNEKIKQIYVVNFEMKILMTYIGLYLTSKNFVCIEIFQS